MQKELARVLVLTGFLLLPFLYWPFSLDPHVSAKWVGVYAITALALWGVRKDLGKPPLGLIVPASAFALLGGSFDLVVGMTLIWVSACLFQNTSFNITQIAKPTQRVTGVILGLYWLGFNPFGHDNFLSEFLGFSYLLQIWAGATPWLWVPTFITLGVLKTRAVWLAVFVGIFVLLPLGRWKKAGLAAALSALLLVLFTQMGAVKKEGATTRLTRWKNTVTLIAKNPLGIGPGRFEFGYLPYSKGDPEAHEELIIKSPHNNYLEVIAEYGWFPGGLLIAGFVALFFTLPKGGILSALFLYWGVDAFFSFPLELPYPFFSVMVLTGLALGGKYPLEGRSRLAYVLAPVLLVMCVFFTYSKVMENQTKWDPGLACKLFPPNWQTCIQAAKFHKNEPEKAQAILERVLVLEPKNTVALKMLGSLYLQTRDTEKACQKFSAYDALYFNDSSLHKAIGEVCKK